MLNYTTSKNLITSPLMLSVANKTRVLLTKAEIQMRPQIVSYQFVS